MGSSYQYQTPQISNKDVTYNLLKIFTKFIISFSMFTFFLSNPSWLSLFLQSFISHISSFPSLVVSHINDKNYIFLLFNGILVIILKKSSNRKKTEHSNDFQSPEPVINTNEMPPPEVVAEVEKDILMLGKDELREKESEDKNEFQLEEQGGNGGEENNRCVKDEKHNEYYGGGAIEQVEEVLTSKMSTEELNRKFEEFIRKTKEEIRTEAQQQFLMV